MATVLIPASVLSGAALIPLIGLAGFIVPSCALLLWLELRFTTPRAGQRQQRISADPAARSLVVIVTAGLAAFLVSPLLQLAGVSDDSATKVGIVTLAPVFLFIIFIAYRADKAKLREAVGQSPRSVERWRQLTQSLPKNT